MGVLGLVDLLRLKPLLLFPFASATPLFPVPYDLTHADWNYRYPIPTLFLLTSGTLVTVFHRALNLAGDRNLGRSL